MRERNDRRYERFEKSNQELRPVDCEQRQTDIFKENYNIDISWSSIPFIMSCLHSATAHIDPPFPQCRLCSPICVQLVMIWLRSYVAALHIQFFALPVAPQTVRCRGGGLSRAHSLGRPSFMPQQHVTTRESFFWVNVVFLSTAIGCLPLFLPLRETGFCGLTQERLGC